MYKIGSGSYGEVFLKDRNAYKYIPKLDKDGYPLDSAIREIFALQYLNHPNIIKGDISYTKKDVIIKMKYYPFTLLSERIRRKTDQYIKYLYQLIHACVYMESVGFMHRDLKPENILVDDHNLVIADFSLSIWALESTYSNVQTVCYRAPEVFAGSKYNGKIDVWSVGIIIYEMINDFEICIKKNEEPIEYLAQMIGITKQEADLFRQNHNCKFPSREFKQGWSSKKGLLGDLCMKMLSFNPEYRPTFTECLQHPVFNNMKKIKVPSITFSIDDIKEEINRKGEGFHKTTVEYLYYQIISDELPIEDPKEDLYNILKR